MIDFQFIEEPVIQGPVILKFQRTNGVGDLLNGIGLAVGKIIHRIYAPITAGPMMLRS